MGQRHQLFVVAKVGNRWRSLAAIHHQWLYGQSALKRKHIIQLHPALLAVHILNIQVSGCLRILRIFQDPQNRLLIEHEVDRAYKLPSKKWDKRADDCIPEFPFITTCLLLGASFDPELRYSHVGIPEPWNMPFNGNNNNDGITVINISDPANVEYAFIFFHAGDPDVPEHMQLVPLTAAEYMALYSSQSLDLSSSFKDFPLISDEILCSAWPNEADAMEWTSRIQAGLATTQRGVNVNRTAVSPEKQQASLWDTSIVQVIKQAQQDELKAWISQLKAIPRFQASLRSYLETHPDQVLNTPSGLLLLSLGFTGLKELDLRPFPGLQRSHIIQLIQDSECTQLSMLDLTGNKNIKLQDIEAFLSIVQVQKLCLWDNEMVDLDVLRDLANKHGVSELLHPSLFRTVFEPCAVFEEPMASYGQHSKKANVYNKCIADPEHRKPYISQVVFISEVGDQSLIKHFMSFALNDYDLEPKGFLAAVQQWMMWLNMECDNFIGSNNVACAGAMAMAFQKEVC